MPQYEVECTGVAREVYIVEAKNANEALDNWHTGSLVISEVSSVEPIAVRREDT